MIFNDRNHFLIPGIPISTKRECIEEFAEPEQIWANRCDYAGILSIQRVPM